MDDQYIDAVAGILVAAAGAMPKICEKCGGHDVIVAAIPVDPQVGAACLPVTYCRSCDAESPDATRMFAAFDGATEFPPDGIN